MPFPRRGRTTAGRVWSLVHSVDFSAVEAADWSGLGDKTVDGVTFTLGGSGLTTFGPNGTTGIAIETQMGNTNAQLGTDLGALAAAGSHTLDRANDYCLLMHFPTVPALANGNYYGAFVRNEGGGDHNNLRGYAPVFNHMGSVRLDVQNTTGFVATPTQYQIPSANPKSLAYIYRRGLWFEPGASTAIVASPADITTIGAFSPTSQIDLEDADVVDLPYPPSSDLIVNLNVGTSVGSATPEIVLGAVELWVLPAAA